MTGLQAPSALDRSAFVAAFGGVFEHSPWVAEAAFDAGLSQEADGAEGLHRLLCAAMRAGTTAQQQALIEAHPDLAGRLARAGNLTADSTAEQASAGLDRLSDADYERFVALNEAYRGKFRFPFIMAVKGSSKDEIMAAFEQRLENDPESEFAEALAQIERIALLRLQDLLP